MKNVTVSGEGQFIAIRVEQRINLMNWEKILIVVVSSIAVSILTSFLKKGNADELKKNLNGTFVLRLPKMYKYMGVVSILIISFFLIGTCFAPEKLMFVMSGLMLLLFGGLGVPCLLAYRNYKLEFDDKNIAVFNWRGRKQKLQWTEIEDIKFGKFSGYLKFYGKNRVLKISHHLNGLNTFLKEMDQKTKWNSKDLKIPGN